jgi:hypothetical protein
VLHIVGNDTREKIKFCCLMEEKRSFSLNDDEHSREFERLKPEVLRGLSLELSSGSPTVEAVIICNVYTYFHIASRRVIDTICMTCEIGFAEGLGEKIRKDLAAMLGIIGKDGMEISENLIQDELRGLNERKQTVERSLKVLDGARAELRGLGDDDDNV